MQTEASSCLHVFVSDASINGTQNHTVFGNEARADRYKHNEIIYNARARDIKLLVFLFGALGQDNVALFVVNFNMDYSHSRLVQKLINTILISVSTIF